MIKYTFTIAKEYAVEARIIFLFFVVYFFQERGKGVK